MKRRCSLFSKYLSHKGIAVLCGAYPITYPREYPTPRYNITKLITLNYLFRFISYNQIDRKLHNKNTIYVKTDELNYFKKDILPKIKTPFTLITGDSDYGIRDHEDIPKNKYLIHWFAQNDDLFDKKISPIPIGLNYSSLIFENCLGEKRQTVEEQEKKIKEIINEKTNQKLKVFANFHLNITSKRRKDLYNLLKHNQNIVFQKEKIPRSIMWKEQKKYAFCFSPIGNGLDCHRTWESLILGQIPIVEKTNTPLDKLYEEFPIVIINDISEITENNLKKWHKKHSKRFTPKMKYKLTTKYWVNKITS